jgi:hypothetical protein
LIHIAADEKSLIGGDIVGFLVFFLKSPHARASRPRWQLHSKRESRLDLIGCELWTADVAR